MLSLMRHAGGLTSAPLCIKVVLVCLAVTIADGVDVKDGVSESVLAFYKDDFG